MPRGAGNFSGGLAGWFSCSSGPGGRITRARAKLEDFRVLGFDLGFKDFKDLFNLMDLFNLRILGF
jgi:hypothetical protein